MKVLRNLSLALVLYAFVVLPVFYAIIVFVTGDYLWCISIYTAKPRATIILSIVISIWLVMDIYKFLQKDII